LKAAKSSSTDNASSDVDAEVLADYVIALVTTNEAEADVKRNCIEQLSEFLADSAYLRNNSYTASMAR
jgi:hypothetical protein